MEGTVARAKNKQPGSQRHLIQTGATVRVSMTADPPYRGKTGTIDRMHRNQAWVNIPGYPDLIRFSRGQLQPA